MESEYFTLCLFPRAPRHIPLLISNNPPEFLPQYLSVFKKDFLLESLIGTGREYVLSRDPEARVPEHGDFIDTVQRARPVSDILYIPIRFHGCLLGFWALGRAEQHRPPYSESQIELFQFVSDFLSDSLRNSFLPSASEDDLAYLDEKGTILFAGPAAAEAFNRLFGGGRIACTPSRNAQRERFLAGYRRFLGGAMRVGSNRITLESDAGIFSFSFELLDSACLLVDSLPRPCAAVRLMNSERYRPEAPPWDLSSLVRKFRLTQRECEVINGIFQAKSNKMIAYDLRIDESTVKRHTHNIYEKTGFRSRVELVRSLSFD